MIIRPMHLATVRALGALCVAFAVCVAASKVLSVAHDWNAASHSATLDFVVERELGEAALAAVIAVAAYAAGRWLLRRPAAAAPALTVLTVLAVSVSLAPGIRGLERGTSLALSPRQREAFEYLRHAEALEMPLIGLGGARSRGYLAMRILQRSLDADGAFEELIDSGTVAGRLYGLCGLYEKNPLAFALALPRFRNSADDVQVWSGCVIQPERVAEVVCSENGMRIPRGVSVDEWWKHSSESERMRDFDICGGAIPLALSGRHDDPAAASLDERRAEFTAR